MENKNWLDMSTITYEEYVAHLMATQKLYKNRADAERFADIFKSMFKKEKE